MTYNEFKEKIFTLSKKEGFEAQIEFNDEREFSIRYANDDIDQYTDASKFFVVLKVLKNGKIGKSTTETLENPEETFYEAVSNWKIIDSEDENFFYDGKGNYLKIQTYSGKFEKLTVKEKIEFVKKLYASAKCDKKIVMVPYALFQHFTFTKKLSNTLGLDLETKSDGAYSFAMAISQDSSNHSGFWMKVGKNPEDLDPEEIGKKACNEALSLLGAKTVKSGKYRVIIRNTAFDSMLGLFKSMISAENVQKNMSPLKGKLNKKISNDVLTIIDTPYHPLSITNRSFDDEGVPTKEKAIIENGVLKTFLHNLKTAKKDKVEPTGNAIGRTGIGPINLMVQPGNSSFDDLVKKLDNGLIITSVDGMHSGANPISGDFSLGARGYKVDNGKIIGAVEQITISGNFLELIKKIEDVGNDILVTLGTITPSVLIEEIDIAGK
ncbi:TldD/PmbA family protein [Thermosipho atlanticus]|uniref:PmbA protein n=1 Tax=Thermosipho atlanticus DSM 15807 TaxID=1123380 RepID=A0A1M5SDM2_9BACT|nr:metallopeptidase TldD-related protein [Thermosipho atlanticus]SHH36702.1 PmbA protein [Thermosipho atlanticus DSM 15807]